MIDLFLVLVDRYFFIQRFFPQIFANKNACFRLSNVCSLVTRHQIDHVGTRPRMMFVYFQHAFKMEGDSTVRGYRDAQIKRFESQLLKINLLHKESFVINLSSKFDHTNTRE